MKLIKVLFFKNAVDTLSREYQYKMRKTQLNNKLSDDPKALEKAILKLRKTLDINCFGEDPKTKDEFVLQSGRMPDQNIGEWISDSSYTGLDYLLESYGLQSVWDTLLPSLNKIDKNLDAYKVHWESAYASINSLLTELKDKLNKTDGKYYGVYSMPMFTDYETVYRTKSAHDVLLLTANERNRMPGNSLNKKGFFLSEAKELYSIVHGLYKDQECIYVTYYQDLTLFVNMLELIEETIESIYKLSEDKRSKAYLVETQIS